MKKRTWVMAALFIVLLVLLVLCASLFQYEISNDENVFIRGVAEFRAYMQTYFYLIEEESVSGYLSCERLFTEMTLHPENVKKHIPELVEALAYLVEDYNDRNGFDLISTIIEQIEAQSDTSENSDFWAVAAHFYLDGKGYFYNGKLTYELPEGYEYVGDVINVGDTASTSRKDFEGNVDGKIYMNQSISDTAYFSWAEWNEEIDGTAPFLKLEVKENS